MYKNFSFYFILVYIFGGMQGAQADVVMNDDKAILLYQGKKLSPMCLRTMISYEEESDRVDLKKCISNSDIQNIETSEDKNGFMSANYEYKMQLGSESYVSYKIIGKYKDGVAVEASARAGHSRTLTNVMTLKIEGDTLLKMDEFYGGDRCSYGITKAEVVGGNLVIEQNVTQSGFITLIEDSRLKAEMRDNFEGSPINCYAKAVYVNKILSGVVLNDGYPPNLPSEHAGDNLRDCLDFLYTKQAKTKKQLDVKEYKEFRDVFFKECIKQ